MSVTGGAFCVQGSHPQGLVALALAARETFCESRGVAYLYQNHVYSSLSFRTETVPPLVSFVHFPINLKSRLAEKVQIRRNGAAEQSWGCLLTLTSGHRGSLQADSSSPPFSLLPSLPFLFICCLSTSPTTLPDSRLCSLSLCIFHLSQ